MVNSKPQPHARAEPYCFLCQKIVPGWPSYHTRPGDKPEPWEHQAVAGMLCPFTLLSGL